MASPGSHGTVTRRGRGHSRAREAPIGVQKHLPVVHHHHVPQSDQGGLRGRTHGLQEGRGRGSGGQGSRGAGPAGLTAKSSKLLAQYSSCSKLPQGAELLSGARLQGHDKLGQGWGRGHGRGGPGTASAPARLEPVWAREGRDRNAPISGGAARTARGREPQTNRANRASQTAGSRSGPALHSTRAWPGLKLPSGAQGWGRCAEQASDTLSVQSLGEGGEGERGGEGRGRGVGGEEVGRQRNEDQEARPRTAIQAHAPPHPQTPHPETHSLWHLQALLTCRFQAPRRHLGTG